MTEINGVGADRESSLPPEVRVGDVERIRAIDLLELHFEKGRLTPEEFDRRCADAASARTRGDLAPLFDDLPADERDPVGGDHPAASGSVPPRSRVKDTMMGLAPLVCVALFFLLNAAGTPNAWLVFLLIPASGVLLYGPERRQDRRETREIRRRRE